MKLFVTLIFLFTIFGTILCGTYRLADVKPDVGIKSNAVQNGKHRHGGEGRGRGREHCTGDVTTATNSPISTTRSATLSSLLPFPPFTAPGQTPFPNIDVRDSEVSP